MATMWQVIEAEKLNGVFVMLLERAVYFSYCPTLSDAVSIIKHWTCSEVGATAQISNHVLSFNGSWFVNWNRWLTFPAAPRLMCFKLCSKLMSLQKQLDASYYGNKYLWDILSMSFVIPSIQVSLLDSISRTNHELVNRFANWILDKPRIAGTSSALYPPQSAPLCNRHLELIITHCILLDKATAAQKKHLLGLMG